MDAQLVLQNWEACSYNEKKNLRLQLAQYINDLLLNDFDQLVLLLYRVDVSEVQLKKVLVENKTVDAGELIADLLIKRQEEKIALRRSFPPAKDISEDERW